MKLYESKETTPLKFYKFFMYVFVPIGFLGCLCSVGSYIVNRDLNWYYTTLFANGAILLVLYALMFWGMLKWKKFTFIVFVVFFAICLVNFAANAIYFSTDGNIPAYNYQFQNSAYSGYVISMAKSIVKVTVIVTSIVSVALNFLVFAYFFKRKNLFDGIPYKIPAQKTQQSPNQYLPQSAYFSTQRCIACGAPRPSPEHVFCPHCGRKFE